MNLLGEPALVGRHCGSSEYEVTREVVEFYSKESTPEYYRYLPKGKVFKPVFAFAFPNNKDGKFEVEQCFESRGYEPGGTVKEREKIKRLVYGYFG